MNFKSLFKINWENAIGEFSDGLPKSHSQTKDEIITGQTRQMTRSRLSFLLAMIFIAHQGLSQSRTLLENVHLIDGTGKPMQSSMSVLIAGDTIQQVFSSGQSVEGDDIERIDLSGKYLLPGLFDMHVHFATSPSGFDQLDLVKSRLEKYLQRGITGVRDMAGDTRQLTYLSRQASLDETPSPDLYFSSLMAGKSFFDDPRTAASAQGHTPGETAWMRAITDDTDIALAVAQAKGTGASGIKIYADLPAHLSAKVIKEARKQNFLVWAHAAVIPAMPGELVAADIHSVSHGPLLAWEVAENKPESGKQRYNDTDLDVTNPKFQALLQAMAEKQVFLDPTVKVYSNRENIYQNGIKATLAAFKAGVPLVVGTDIGIRGRDIKNFPLIDEMEIWVKEVGIPAIEVIKAATLNSARLLRIDEQTGSIATGKKANLLIVDDNPLEDMTHLMKVHSVYKNGKKVDQ